MTSQGTVAKYLGDGRDPVLREKTEGHNSDGRRNYVPLASCWRCGSGMMLPHSTQRTLPASCSSSVTQSEIRRLCIQAQSGLNGRG